MRAQLVELDDLGMQRRKETGSRLLIWTSTGVALDVTALIGIWLALDVIGPVNFVIEIWADLTGFVMIPWLVHSMALPAIFGITKPTAVSKYVSLLWRSAAFMLLSAAIIPSIGILVVVPFGFIVALVVTGGSLRFEGGPPTLAYQMLNDAVWTAIAIIVGGSIGSLLHSMREEDFGLQRPSVRSDVLGAATAAFLLFAGMFAASSYGLFARTVAGDWMHRLYLVPQLPVTLLVGTVALLPHLLMIGVDLLCSDTRRAG